MLKMNSGSLQANYERFISYMRLTARLVVLGWVFLSLGLVAALSYIAFRVVEHPTVGPLAITGIVGAPVIFFLLPVWLLSRFEAVSGFLTRLIVPSRERWTRLVNRLGLS